MSVIDNLETKQDRFIVTIKRVNDFPYSLHENGFPTAGSHFRSTEYH